MEQTVMRRVKVEEDEDLKPTNEERTTSRREDGKIFIGSGEDGHLAFDDQRE